LKVLVTGGTGFAGRWLVRELTESGHAAVAMPGRAELDIGDRPGVAAVVAETRPDVIAHLAGLAFGPDARRDPAYAMAVNEGGTRSILEAALTASVPCLIVSSSDVYGVPDAADLPLDEDAPCRADQPYGLSKLAAERAARDAAAAGLRVVIVRPFNHTGPGQRQDFVVPALATRIVAARSAGHDWIEVGNVDVRRDIGDVHDVVRAYRLLLDALERGDIEAGTPEIFNVATGRATTIRSIVLQLAELADFEVELRVDASLVRSNDPPEIRGDASRLMAAVGWRPLIPLETTLRDVLADVERRSRDTT
jgi:GDP-4-dehydro-6-deoxy-D-mannose reductase